MGEESSSFHVLEDDVEVLLIVEVSVQGQDVLVVQEGLEFEFEDELVDHEVRFDHFLRDFLYRINGIGLLVNGLVDSSELPFAQRFSKVEVIKPGTVAKAGGKLPWFVVFQGE